MSPHALFALAWTTYRLQLSTAALWMAYWQAVWEKLMLPSVYAKPGRNGPTLGQMYAETMRDTFGHDGGAP